MLNNLYDISNTMRPGDNFTFDFSDEFVCVLSKSLKHNDTSFLSAAFVIISNKCNQ